MKGIFSRHVSYGNSRTQKQTTWFPNCIDSTSQNLPMMDESMTFFVSALTGSLVLSTPKRHNKKNKNKQTPQNHVFTTLRDTGNSTQQKHARWVR